MSGTIVYIGFSLALVYFALIGLITLRVNFLKQAGCEPPYWQFGGSVTAQFRTLGFLLFGSHPDSWITLLLWPTRVVFLVVVALFFGSFVWR